MQVIHQNEAPNAIRSDLGAIFVSLELSRSTWLITSLSPAGLFSSQYRPDILRSWFMSRAARQRAFLMFSQLSVRSRLYAKERMRATMSGFLRMREASSAKVALRA